MALMNLKHLAIVLLLGLASGRIDTSVTSDECAKCIQDGKIFCFKGADGEVFADERSYTDKECAISVDLSTKQRDALYICSNKYTDKDYAIAQMCPQITTLCGSEQTISFSKEGEKKEIKPSMTSIGQSCTYRVQSSCGAPAFELTSDSVVNERALNVTFVEFETARVSVSSLTETSQSRLFVKADKPVRDTKWGDAKNMGDYKGQQLPDVLDSSKTDTTTARSRSVVEPPTDNGDTTTTRTTTSDVQLGYGFPTKGIYNITNKGFKSFGTLGQGTNMDGVRFDTAKECEERQVYIVLIALSTLNERSTIKFTAINGGFAETRVSTTGNGTTDILPANALKVISGSAVALMLAFMSFN